MPQSSCLTCNGGSWAVHNGMVIFQLSQSIWLLLIQLWSILQDATFIPAPLAGVQRAPVYSRTPRKGKSSGELAVKMAYVTKLSTALQKSAMGLYVQMSNIICHGVKCFSGETLTESPRHQLLLGRNKAEDTW